MYIVIHKPSPMTYQEYYLSTSPSISLITSLLLFFCFIVVILELARIISFSFDKKLIIKPIITHKNKIISWLSTIIILALITGGYAFLQTNGGFEEASIWFVTASIMTILTLGAFALWAYLQPKIKSKQGQIVYITMLSLLCIGVFYAIYAFSIAQHPELMEKWRQMQ